MNCPNCNEILPKYNSYFRSLNKTHHIDFKCEKCDIEIDGDEIYYLIYYKGYHINRYGIVYPTEVNIFGTLDINDYSENMITVFAKFKKYVDNIIFE